jgi:hypothetical protein
MKKMPFAHVSSWPNNEKLLTDREAQIQQIRGDVQNKFNKILTKIFKLYIYVAK